MTQQEETLITDEMRANLNKEGPPTTLEVEKTSIRMFARAVGHTDLIFYDEAYAKSKGHRSIVAPPGYLGTPIFTPNSGGFTGPGGVSPSGRPLRAPQRRHRVRVHRHRHLRRRHHYVRIEDGGHERAPQQHGPDADYATRDYVHEPERRSRLPRLRHRSDLLGGREDGAGLLGRR